MQRKDLQLRRALRTALIVLLLSVVGMPKVYATYDFSAVCPTGQTLYYTITDTINHYVAISCPGPETYNDCWSGFTKPAGDITLPESVEYEGVNYLVTAIGDLAFSRCTGLTGDLNIPNSIITIGMYAFCYDGFTGSLTIGNSVTTIGNYAFWGCSGFTGSLTLPNSVTTIGTSAFDSCTGFTGSLTISDSVISIENYAFYWSGFTSLISLAETPPTLGHHVFFNTQLVFVPCGFEEAYASVQWGGFSNFIGMCSVTITAIADPEEGGTVTGGGTYLKGQTCTLTATPDEGYAFLYWLDEANVVVSLDADYTFTVTESRTLTAKFAEENSFCYITFDGSGWGSSYLVVSFEDGSFLQLSGATTLPIFDGSHVTLDWNENPPSSFTVSYSNGNIIYHGENLNSGFSYELDIDCEEMPATMVNVTATLNPDEGGVVSGEGEYEYFTTCTLSATPNEGFLFLNWSRNGELVSCNGTYSFTVTGEMDFDAIFMPIEGVFIGEGEETNAYLPSSCEGYALSQEIYTAEEIGTAGYINSVAFYNGGGQQTRTYDMYMVHTNKTVFSDNHDWIAVTENDRVFSGSVTFVPGYWTTIVLDTQFAYDGVSNLAIILDENSGFAPYEPYIACRVFATEDNQAIYVSSDCWGTNFDPTTPSNYNGTLVNEKNQIYLDIHPCARPTGLVCTGTTSSTANLSWIENGTATDWVVQYSTAEDFTDAISINVSATPFVELTGLMAETYYYAHVKALAGGEEGDWSSTIIFRPTDKVVIGSGNVTSQSIPTHFYYRYSLSQQIYTPEEIGTEGLIAGIDFYNIDQGKTRNIDLYMVNTDKTSFESDNDWITVTEEDLVFSGEVTFTVDDWTTIEFTTPFAYDGTSNLAVIVDDNFGYYYFNGMSFRVYDAPSMAICAHGDGTNYNPYEPANYTGAILNVKNQIRLDIANSNLGVYTVSVASDHEGYGSVSGGGNYIEGRYCTISATPNYGYGFLNWTDTIGNIISVEPTYTFAVEERASFVAHFVEGAIDLYVSRTGWALWKGFGNDGPALEGVATVILTAGDVWGDGTGYQMLMDADANTYGTIIPNVGPLSTHCSGNENIYSQFEYKIPSNADGICTTENIVFNNSVSIDILPGTYDWCLTNPVPNDRIWIVGNYGSFSPRFDNFEFEAGSTYEFVISMFDGHDGVDLFVNGEARSLRENIGITSEGCRSMANVPIGSYSDRVLPVTEKNVRNNLDIVLTLTDRTGDTLYMGTTENNYMQLPTEGLQEDEIYILSIAQVYPSGLTNEMASCRWTYQSCNNFEGVSNLCGIINDDGVTLSWVYPEVDGTRVYDEWAFEQGFVTHPGAMANGADASWKTGSQKGFGAGGVVADDFTCEVLTTINEIEVYAYQAGSSTTSAITGLYVQIYNGNPINDGVVVWGDLETNLMTSTSFTNCYRGSYGNTTDTSRPIMSVTASGLDITLEPGTYFLVYRISRLSGTSQPFFVPYCLPEIGNTGDGLVLNQGTWEYIIDIGTHTPWGFAFRLLGEISVVPSPVNGFVTASIFRDGEWIGFTAYDSFTDPDGTEDSEYEIRVVYGGNKQCPYDNAFFTTSCPQTMTFHNVIATASPTEGGTVAGGGTYNHGASCTLTATANEGYTFVNWTENGQQVSADAAYSFIVSGDRNLVANFTDSPVYLTISAAANPIEGGMTSGDGIFLQGRSCTLTATPNEGYTFINWTKDGEEVSTEAEYSFTVLEDAAFVANFEEQTDITQTSNFTSGWNWYSTYIEQGGIDGLAQLEESLGANGIQIKSQQQYTNYYEGMGWMGMLLAIDNESTYKIKTNAVCTVDMVGLETTSGQHPITVGPGWNWIGYPLSIPMSVTMAFSNINPTNGDQLKAQNGYANYYDGIGWMGTLSTIEPGTGLLYKSNNSQNITLVYPDPEGAKGAELAENVTSDNNHWVPDLHAYPDNMTVTAVVELDDEELQSDSYELAAFANGECRGSVRLMYIESLDRYIAFLTIAGEDVTTLSFSLYNAATGEEIHGAQETLNFSDNAVVGSANEPYVIRFRSLAGMDELGKQVHVFPNPVSRGANVSLGMTEDINGEVQVDIVNAFGAVISVETSMKLPATINAPEVSGVYTLRITVEGKGTCYRKLVVR